MKPDRKYKECCILRTGLPLPPPFTYDRWSYKAPPSFIPFLPPSYPSSLLPSLLPNRMGDAVNYPPVRERSERRGGRRDLEHGGRRKDGGAEGWKRNPKDTRGSPISCRSLRRPQHSHVRTMGRMQEAERKAG